MMTFLYHSCSCLERTSYQITHIYLTLYPRFLPHVGDTNVVSKFENLLGELGESIFEILGEELLRAVMKGCDWVWFHSVKPKYAM